MNKRHTILYLGLQAPEPKPDVDLIHYPVIRIIPRPFNSPDIQIAFHSLPEYTHLIFTSKSSVDIFTTYLSDSKYTIAQLSDKCGIATGKATAERMREHGIPVHIVAAKETSEGVTTELEKLNLSGAKILWPHAALARPVISHFLIHRKIPFHECILYDTEMQCPHPSPDLSLVDEIIFTSPSTVDAFLQKFGHLPTNKTLTAIGPVTASRLQKDKRT